MSTPTFKAALAPTLLLAACAPESGAPQGLPIECAQGEGAAFGADCVLESAGGDAFTIHHPDNSFVRIRYDAVSNMLSVADGAEPLEESPDPEAGLVEFAIGSYRYRMDRAALLSSTP